ncbi:actin [Anaeramoeba flamelloides]|uniref:Actin n=1 Tax=Anaeramoeba flamelloides TaxID=1746091 RepID=A0ABQ8Y521_9EUKA|nr:actin [Anaeramoeba flamelloides]
MTSVVIDFGTSSFKYGVAGDRFPKKLQCSSFGDPWNGEDIIDWVNFKKLINKIFENLCLDPKECKVLVCLPVHQPYELDCKLADYFFNLLKIQAIYFCLQPVLSCYSFGRLSGAVMEIGHSMLQMCIIENGFSISDSISCDRLGAVLPMEYLQKEYKKKGVDLNLTQAQQLLKEHCHVSSDIELESRNVTPVQVYGYQQTIALGQEKFLAYETLFNNSLLGSNYKTIVEIFQSCLGTIQQSQWPKFLSNIIISGGLSHAIGITERIRLELIKAYPQNSINVIKSSQTKRINEDNSFIGASILGSLVQFKEKWVVREKFLEIGNKAINICYRVDKN